MRGLKIIVFVILAMFVAFTTGAVLAAPNSSKANLPSAYYVHSENPVLMALFGVSHRFAGVFSTELSPAQLGLVKKLGVKIEPVQIYRIVAKPFCNNNGVCEPELGENPSCWDCKNGGEEPSLSPSPEERSCYPASQEPWGITTVNGGSGGVGVTVAVLDTGVDQDHLDLIANIKDCVTKVTHFIPDAKSCEDGYGHGTHVSGTVLANTGSDGLGIYGVAPDASLMAVKVCDKRGYCYGDDIAAGIRYAADNGANIISMSLSGDNEDPMITDAVDYAITKDVLVVAAAGNDGKDGVGSIDYPGAYIKVVAVAAFDSADTMASFSSLGVNDDDWTIEEKEIEFAGPGVEVESTWKDGCYNTISGTSMSTPHITGIAARDWQGTASETRVYLQSLAEYYTKHVNDYGLSGDDVEAGFGLPIVH